VTAALSLVLSYFWLTFVLRRFPYTRPWGESLREFLVARLAAIGVAVIESIPDLFTVAVVVVVTRFVSRFLHAFFEAVEQNRLQIPLIYPETAQPTRRIATALLWLFALAVSYPYLPGSESEAFKGISVFVGLIVSLGSSGIVGQMMSGLTITYSRAVRLGDYVRIGDIEGTVTHLGSLSTKVKTERREDVTIPNSVVVSTPMTNYSRFADVEGVMTPTSVTVGYNVPWRQIHAMLLLAAERTPGIRKSPAPAVRQSQFENNCVEYTLLTCLEDPNRRHAMLGVLRSNILDVFNEFGVQIMTPSYEGDPDAPKIVPPEQWYAAPAVPPARGDSPDTAVKTSVP
jgi:small-conductance mechanosensitive channel